MALSLRRFREFYKKSGIKGYVHPSPSSNLAALLPVELWDHIASMVELKSDSSRLSRTNRILCSICRPYIYHSISITIDTYLSVQRLKGLCRAIKNPDIADLVEDVSILSPSWDIRAYKTPFREDKLVGMVLIPLGNLRKLTFCCRNRCTKGLHRYLTQLTTRSLATLELDCFCFASQNPICYEILCAPCMRGITSIHFYRDYYPYFKPGAVQAAIASDSLLPNLKEITARYIPLFTSHFRRGVITKVYIYGSEGFRVLNDLLSSCPSAILDLVCPTLLEHIPQLVQNPIPYCKLRTIAYFVFRHKEQRLADNILTSLSRLSCLPLLNSVEIHIIYHQRPKNYHPYNEDRNPTLVQDLQQELSRISKVYIKRTRYYIHSKEFSYETWVFEGSWRSTHVDNYGTSDAARTD